MIPRYSNRLKLCFTDTDSLLYEIETLDIYKDMLDNKSDYDFSNYPYDHPNFNIDNKKVIGKFKDELNGLLLLEFIGLRPKCYSLLYDKGKEKQTAKGTKHRLKKLFYVTNIIKMSWQIWSPIE